MRIRLLAFITFLSINFAYSQEYRGNVVSIADGDTFTLLTADKS